MKALVILALIAMPLLSSAQTWKEFFKQKKTQKKYLIQQIAALKLYAGYVKKGYETVNSGLKTIKGFTQGEFNLHQDFFNSLSHVNPVIAGDPRVKEIVVWQQEIVKFFREADRDKLLNSSEVTYLENVRSNLLLECRYDLETLELVITNDELEMKDDERIQRLDLIHERMKEKFVFTQSFLAQISIIQLQRTQEAKSNKSVERQY